jgi:hypothetical protein
MRKIWDFIVGLLYKVPFDKWLHAGAGLLAASFFAIALGWPGWAAFLMAVALGGLKEAFDWFTTRVVEWLDLVATACGGAVVLVWWLLHLWWF